MTMLASIRPDDWNWLLLGHLLGVAALFASLVTVFAASAATRAVAGADAVRVRGFVLRTIAFLAWPGFLVTIGLGHALQSKEDAGGSWLDVSSTLGEVAGFVGLGILTYFASVALRRARSGQDATTAVAASAIVAPVLIVVLVVVLFLMTGKP